MQFMREHRHVAVEMPGGKAQIERSAWREFGRLLTTHAGWGIRLVFVPDNELHEKPRIVVREPKMGKAQKPNRKRARA